MYPQITLTEASDNLSQLCEQVINDREVLIITREKGENVVIMPADELEHFLKLTRIFSSLQKHSKLLNNLQEDHDNPVKHQTVDELLDELGLSKV